MMRYLIPKFVVFFSCLTTLAFASDICPDGEKASRAAVRHIEAGGIGYNQGYTTLELFLSPGPDWWTVMPFLDARGHIFDNGKWAANLGVGARKTYGSRVYGVNAYYDYRQTKKLHYNQVGVGLETLGELWDLRANGYFPVGKKTSAPYGTEFASFSGNFLLLSQKEQFAMKGVNAEAGFHFGKSPCFDFYAAAGPYYFEGKGRNAWGGKARICGMFREYISVEISDSYDNVFHNRFQGQLTFSFPFGTRSCVRQKECQSCSLAYALDSRMVQPIARQEIIVVSSKRKEVVATDPTTGEPLFFVFVDNTSSSEGTFESPYPTFAQAQSNSSPGNIIYVFPGNGTTSGMDSGIALQASQKLWGSGIDHSLQTSQGEITIPAQSNSSPTITNTNVDTEGNAITLATNNAISGFTIASAMNDAIFGTDPQSLDVSYCTFQNTTTFPVEATFSGDANISITSNQFLDNVNGISLILNGTSTIACLGNTFTGQTSISSAPLEIAAHNNSLSVSIENNVFDSNVTGSIRFGLDTTLNADIGVLNNRITNNGTGSQSSLGSSFVILSTGTNDHCSLAISGNTFSENTGNAIYLHTSGAFTTLEAAIAKNTMTNTGSAAVFATPADNLQLIVTNNTIATLHDNGIAIIGSGTSSTGNIIINNNTLTDIGNNSNGISNSQQFSTLHLTILNNQINGCEGTGILSYTTTPIDSLALNVSGNTISNCMNGSSNAASGLDIEQFTNLSASVTNNIFTDNVSPDVAIGTDNPTACLYLSGNTSTFGYNLTNNVGTFNLAPCNAADVNTGMINESGTITHVNSCADETPCPP